MHLQLVQFRPEYFHYLGRGRNVALAGYDCQLTGERAVQIAYSRLLGRDAKDRVLHDMHLGPGFVEALAQFRQLPYLEALVVDYNEEGRGVQPGQDRKSV